MKAEQGSAAGEIPPPAAVTPVPDWLTEYWRAWWTLHHDRPKSGGGMGPPEPGRIPWRDLLLWSEQHPHIDFDLLQAVAEEMDAVYLNHWAAEVAKAMKKKPKRGRGSGE